MKYNLHMMYLTDIDDYIGYLCVHVTGFWETWST